MKIKASAIAFAFEGSFKNIPRLELTLKADDYISCNNVLSLLPVANVPRYLECLKARPFGPPHTFSDLCRIDGVNQCDITLFVACFVASILIFITPCSHTEPSCAL